MNRLNDAFPAAGDLATELPLPDTERLDAISRLRDYLRSERRAILEVLTEAATFQAAEAEIQASERALAGAVDEVLRNQPVVLDHLAAFMPSNVLLYSYILYAVIPSLYIRKISLRPSSYVKGPMERLHELLSPQHRLPIEVLTCEQKTFVDQVAREADVVVFTGTFGNADKLRKSLSKKQLFIFFGQGVNPFIVGPSADLDKAVRDLIQVRLFNSGQDCMGPDAIFVPESHGEAFLSKLQAELGKLTFGSRKHPDADYGPLFYGSAVDEISKYLLENEQRIVHGGAVRYSTRHVEPTVIFSSLRDRADIVEFFGPIFNVISYASVEELVRELSLDLYTERALGASVYAVPEIEEFLRKRHMVSVDCTLFDIEDGNSPFGGYGRMANYAWCNGDLRIEPILLSRTIARMKGSRS
ncbi:aldehyde dehydrogenase family protein [Bradyrhizobium uaiense]|uniref:Aldehyde dehydrogenase n=1 Tax=Bradyrhizobium uaiense TaxID=2594946 RepID=A0A6P1BIG1_9BRAD|nr:aldehyde dehydrogenase family protein [Bradyrhizobium uaiense]NEU98326.1 aldehyde dehydrogenase [Bradyrhizobium uaiense]